jgi:TonB family protein
VIRKIDPNYTAQAKADEIVGTVSVRLTVNEQGFPTNVTLYRGIDPGLDRRAVEAVRQWRFLPATCDGEPIARPAVVDVHFQLYYPGQAPPPQPPPPPAFLTLKRNDSPPDSVSAPSPEPEQGVVTNGSLAPRLFIAPRTRSGVVGNTIWTRWGGISTTTYYERNIRAEVTSSILKLCPGAVIITNSPDNADFGLILSPGSSVLSDRNGDAVATFNAHFVKTAGKDICGYFQFRETER